MQQFVDYIFAFKSLSVMFRFRKVWIKDVGA